MGLLTPISGGGVTQKNYNQYYKKNNNYSDEKIKAKVNREINLTRTNLIKKYIPLEAEILDVGCGNGDFLVGLQKNNYKNLSGIDPSENSVEVVKKRGINVRVGNIFDAVSEKDDKYDVVCCTAVLEHIYDLEGCIEKLKCRLKGAGSKIFVDVPGMEGINQYLAMPAEHFNCEHINYFTFSSLDNLFLINGFKRISEKKDYYHYLKETSVPILSIGAIYELTESFAINIEKDIESAEQILQYFSTVEKQINKKNNLLKEAISGEKRIVIWGGGNYAFQMLAYLPEIEEKIAFFIDSNCNKQGTMIVEKEIKTVDMMPTDNSLVVICSMNYAKEMAAECKKRGVRYYIY